MALLYAKSLTFYTSYSYNVASLLIGLLFFNLFLFALGEGRILKWFGLMESVT